MPVLADYRHLASGKVRELYEVDDELLLFVATDRGSAFDYVLPTAIPDKGRVLTALSVFWFSMLGDVENHLVSIDDPRIPAEVRGRALLVRRLEMVPVECVARGYLTGTGLADYRSTGSVCGIPLPPGLDESSKLETPLFTPSTKAELGSHDENVSYATIVAAVGQSVAAQLRDLTLHVYRAGSDYAGQRGIVLADTKLEFGLLDGRLVLGDEVLTPDSSRFWPADTYRPGSVQPSFDKQYLRDWLTSPESRWDRRSGARPPGLPDDVVDATRQRYVTAYERLTGLRFADWSP